MRVALIGVLALALLGMSACRPAKSHHIHRPAVARIHGASDDGKISVKTY